MPISTPTSLEVVVRTKTPLKVTQVDVFMLVLATALTEPPAHAEATFFYKNVTNGVSFSSIVM